MYNKQKRKILIVSIVVLLIHVLTLASPITHETTKNIISNMNLSVYAEESSNVITEEKICMPCDDIDLILENRLNRSQEEKKTDFVLIPDIPELIKTGQEKIEAVRDIIIERDNTIDYGNVVFTRYTDIKENNSISVEEMDYLIDKFLQGRQSSLKGCGDAFVEASKQSGISPGVLLCLAGQEAGWQVSSIHLRKNNPYSISMIDGNTEAGYILGSSFKTGIVNGAIWINEKYYNKSQVNLHEFIYGCKCYSTSKDTWINTLVYNVNKSYKYLEDYQNINKNNRI